MAIKGAKDGFSILVDKIMPMLKAQTKLAKSKKLLEFSKKNKYSELSKMAKATFSKDKKDLVKKLEYVKGQGNIKSGATRRTEARAKGIKFIRLNGRVVPIRGK